MAYVLNRLSLEDCENKEKYCKVKKIVGSYNSTVAKMWKYCKRTLKVFEARHHQWLDEEIVFFCENTFAQTSGETSSAKRGRPHKRLTMATPLEDFSESFLWLLQ